MKPLKILCLMLLFPSATVTTLKAQVTTTEEKLNTYYEYEMVTSIESIVPAGLGRSRLIANGEERDYRQFTTQRSEDKKNNANRKDIRVEEFEETKLLNFFDLGGIRFENIAANDAVVSSKINDMTAHGWELAFVTSAVESSSGVDDGEGIFITRYIFRREVQE